MSRHWSEIPQYQKDDPTWGIEGCAECHEYEGDHRDMKTWRPLCENCWEKLQQEENEKLS